MTTILVVDDDPTVREVVSRYLSRDGHQVMERSNGVDGLSAALSESPDLVVLDLMMPGMDGLAVCRELRRHSAVPVIILTALGEESDRVVGLEYGADDYVTKPFSPRELALRVAGVLRRSRHDHMPAPVSPAPVGATVDGDLRIDAAARPADVLPGSSRSGVLEIRIDGAGLGLDLRRRVDRHRSRPPVAGEDRARSGQPTPGGHGVGRRLPIRRDKLAVWTDALQGVPAVNGVPLVVIVFGLVPSPVQAPWSALHRGSGPLRIPPDPSSRPLRGAGQEVSAPGSNWVCSSV
jgi:CheY-like chemotaxis protein